jgi:hypothetical protein
MRWFKAEYQWRGQGAGQWGHTVRLTENPEHKSEKFYGTTIDPEEIEEVWQFKSAEEANQFIMIYNLRWS